MATDRISRRILVRIAVLIAVFASIIYLIANNIGTFGNILIVIVGFGAVVLIHEFGHFIMAKLGGIKVEAFSIGFSPILAGIKKTDKGFRFRILPELLPAENIEKDEENPGFLNFSLGKNTKPGETEYRIGLIPFGGFVKMLGQDDTKVAGNSDDPRSYANKPVSTRMAVIAAGVTFNIISAVIIFIIVFMIGVNQSPPIIGTGVIPGSPAAQAEIRPGSEVISISGKTDYLEFGDIILAGALSGKDQEVTLRVRREDGIIETHDIKPEETNLGTGPIRSFGFLPADSLTIADVRDPDNLLARTKLEPGDTIKAVNGIDVETNWQFSDIVADTYKPSVTVLAERKTNGQTELIQSELPLSLATRQVDAQAASELGHVYSMVPRMRISTVSEPAEKLTFFDRIAKRFASDAEDEQCVAPKLKPGDIILQAGDIENPTYIDLRSETEAHAGREMTLKVMRQSETGSEIHTVKRTPYIGINERVVLGIGIDLDAANPIVAHTIEIDNGPEQLAIPAGAAITTVDGIEVSNWWEIVDIIRSNPDQRVTLEYRLDEEIAGSFAINTVADSNYITVEPDLAEPLPFKPLQRIYKADGPGEALTMGYKKTIALASSVYVSLQRVFGGLLSPQNFMGPVGILSFSYQIVAQRPILEYIFLMGQISVFLAVFNFLPILPFDGGHFVFLIAEKIKGSPVNEKFQAAVTYAGLILVLIFAVYVTFNDIVRSFFS